MDELTQTLLERQFVGAGPTIPAKVPPAWKRYLTAEKMKAGYANNWEPNPVLVNILESK